MKEFLVVTEDERLGQLIRLLLKDEGRVSVKKNISIGTDYDCIIADADTVEDCSLANLILSRGELKNSIKIPFRHEELLEKIFKVSNTGAHSLKLAKDGRVALVGEKKILLTEVEGRLLSALIDAGGFISREELLSLVWSGEADGGVVNVYIHYLREKLEKGGEKIILSSRKHGYKIDEKYLEE